MAGDLYSGNGKVAINTDYVSWALPGALAGISWYCNMVGVGDVAFCNIMVHWDIVMY